MQDKIEPRACCPIMKAMRIPLRIVFYKSSGLWVAHCLEFDLCGHGDEKRDAIQMLSEAIRIQLDETIQSQNPRNLFSPADSEIFARFAAGKDDLDATHGELRFSVDSFQIEPAETREYTEDIELQSPLEVVRV
ncbi:MAG: hypothetical protein JNM18_17025 [Planctomycetaceae bacterium]|nr:hypothetical protein [Planctomycetaceae bacterium]